MTKTLLQAIAAACALALAPVALAATPAELLQRYATESGAAANAARGARFFAERHGAEWSCSTCHGTAPVAPGKHAATGKPIAALAPAFNGERFTDPARVEKWFRRNCRDVVARECNAAEKADVLAWLLTFKP
jgi:mono/diheme cytochrome c family protein